MRSTQTRRCYFHATDSAPASAVDTPVVSAAAAGAGGESVDAVRSTIDAITSELSAVVALSESVIKKLIATKARNKALIKAVRSRVIVPTVLLTAQDEAEFLRWRVV